MTAIAWYRRKGTLKLDVSAQMTSPSAAQPRRRRAGQFPTQLQDPDRNHADSLKTEFVVPPGGAVNDSNTMKPSSSVYAAGPQSQVLSIYHEDADIAIDNHQYSLLNPTSLPTSASALLHVPGMRRPMTTAPASTSTQRPIRSARHISAPGSAHTSTAIHRVLIPPASHLACFSLAGPLGALLAAEGRKSASLGRFSAGRDSSVAVMSGSDTPIYVQYGNMETETDALRKKFQARLVSCLHDWVAIGCTALCSSCTTSCQIFTTQLRF